MLVRLAVVFAADTVGAFAVLAAEGSDGIGEFAILFNYGVLGVVTLLWLLGRIETPRRGDTAEARAEAAEERERHMQDTMRGEVIPALIRFTETATRLLDRDSTGGR